MKDQIEQRLKEIEESIGEITPSFDREMAEYIAQSRKDVPFLLALVKRQREALEFVDKEIGTIDHVVNALNFNPETACH